MSEEETKQVAPPRITVKDNANAPIIYFDGVASFGNMNGIVNAALIASRHLLEDGQTVSHLISVGDLRCSIPAAIALREALDKALLLGAKTEGGEN